jgi:hypothetical protein
MDLAIKPGQDGHELPFEQSQQFLRVVTVDQDRNGLERDGRYQRTPLLGRERKVGRRTHWED